MREFDHNLVKRLIPSVNVGNNSNLEYSFTCDWNVSDSGGRLIQKNQRS